MLARTLARAILGFTLLATAAASALASPITFHFNFADPGSTARASGFITFESTLLTNPGNNSFFLPDPAVLDLQVTVSGATAGNGTFGLGAFTQVIFDTNGGTLDFSRPLIGQPTAGAPWASTIGSPGSGDFNLFGVAPSPNGVLWFTLGANGGAAEAMLLTRMTSSLHVPTLGEWGMVVLSLLLGLGAWVALRRQVGKATA